MTGTVAHAAFLFVFLWVLLRIMGKNELSELSAFELITLVVLGDMSSEAVITEDTSLIGGLVAVATFALMTVGLSYLAWRFPKSRPILDGQATIVVRDGKPVRASMDAERMTMDDLISAARRQGFRRVEDIELAVLEPDGTVSMFDRKPD